MGSAVQLYNDNNTILAVGPDDHVIRVLTGVRRRLPSIQSIAEAKAAVDAAAACQVFLQRRNRSRQVQNGAALLCIVAEHQCGVRLSESHAAGGHDDLANVCAGSLTLVTGVGVKAKKQVRFSVGDGDETLPRDKDERVRAQQAALGVFAKTMIAGLERQDQRDWEINRKYEDEPMVPGSVVWHVHQ